MIILAIDTSCDETAAAVTEEIRILSNIIWSQASLHAKFGGVYPTLAKRMHQERIDWVIGKAITNSKTQISSLDAVAVTIGPGLAPALEVGIKYAIKLTKKYNKPLIPVNHVEGHLFSPLARPKNSQSPISNFQLPTSKLFPCLGLVVSGGTTQLILAKDLGKYKILANTIDDALGEALDKGARLLGLGYPGGAVLEKIARLHNVSAKQFQENTYSLPLPMLGRENEGKFSYSGLKTALARTVSKIKNQKGSLSKSDIQELASTYQDVAFSHLIRIISNTIYHLPFTIHHLLVSGGVASNLTLRKKIRKMAKELNITPLFPYSKKLCTDNAAMIGVCAFLKTKRPSAIIKPKLASKIDRAPKFSIEDVL